jgi:hypothetical protein
VSAHIRANFRASAGRVSVPAIAFAVPIASARASGALNLLSKAIDLNGTLAIRTSLSGAAGGLKSLILFPLDPLFKKEGVVRSSRSELPAPARIRCSGYACANQNGLAKELRQA